ncbi:ribonuclease III [Picosynechococcus sp. PCC 11901]|uniref:ribonuclease III n=1 Tax=Picosynechococcus sp. PCC 11901 TaxID=2579791 RepID=UPI0010FC305B|nr:ribonuclease III [Picosynechococcus sp. PCC 11901]QCS48723.1 ribonuclease III [Picosynechococcus sp. PCC 11901]
MSMVPPQRQKSLRRLIDRLGLPDYHGMRWDLLDLALTHPSISPDKNYEQLEFIGDAVVRLAASEVLYAEYPAEPVGEFAAIRSILVSDRTLAEFAHRYNLKKYLSYHGNYHGAGEISLLADAFEAMLGALFLTTNDLSLVHPWLDEHLRHKAAEIKQDPARENYKDALQTWSQGEYQKLPTYQVTENPEFRHEEERFLAEVKLGDTLLGKGVGRSKKAAEQAAARMAFEAIAPLENFTPQP